MAPQQMAGEFGLGNVFKLTPNQDGSWTQTVLHYFAGNGANDGALLSASLIFDRKGNLYGTTNRGGGGDFTTFVMSKRVRDGL
jgi:hypothetical protein